MKRTTNVGLTLALVLLVLANTCLDYSAVCAYLDQDMFSDLDVANLLALTVSLGCGLTLLVLPRNAALEWARGQKGAMIASLVGCLAIAVIIAGLRAAADATTTTVGVDGVVRTTMTTADILFVLVMFCLSVGESVTSFFLSTDAIRGKVARLKALIVRLTQDYDQVDRRIQAVDSMARQVKFEAAAACKMAGESLYQELLSMSGDMQNAFIGYAKAVQESRGRFDGAIDAIVAPSASARTPAQASAEAERFTVSGSASSDDWAAPQAEVA